MQTATDNALHGGLSAGNVAGSGGELGTPYRDPLSPESDCRLHTEAPLPPGLLLPLPQSSPSPGSLRTLAHVLWQAKRAVGCLTSHLLLLLIWGGAG